MRNLQRFGVVIVLFAVAALVVSAAQSPTPYDSRPGDPYSVSATVTPGQNNYVTVRVTVTEKKTGGVVSAPAVTLPLGMTAESFSDRIPGKPEFHTRIVVDQSGKANVTFEAYERVLQRSAVSARPTQ